MSEIASTHKSQFKRIKNNVENAWESFQQNYDRFVEMRNFALVTTMSDNERTLNAELKKPQVEFNITEAYISRLRGEFSKQEPSITVTTRPGKEVNPQMVQVVEGHLRYILQEANKAGLEYHCYTDTLTGGFSGMKVFADYTGEMSFHMDLYIRRVYDPTMVGFDPMSVKEDKSDAMYCFEIFPKRRADLEREFPGIKLGSSGQSSGMSTGLSNFNWSFGMNEDETFLLADYYEKKKVKKTIVMLTDGQVMTKKEYEQYVKDWDKKRSNLGVMPVAPGIVGEPRVTEITKVVRYKLIGSEVVDYEETDYKSLPIIFIDGNSVLTKKSGSSFVQQITRPYIYNAVGGQKLLNFAGQTLANDIENRGPNKMLVAKDAIPPQYLDGYLNPQQTSVYIYNAFKNDNTDVPLPPPNWIPQPPIEPVIVNTFQSGPTLIQNLLGSFDGNMAQMTKEQMSGKAIQEASTLSNASAMPYVVSYMRGLSSAAQLCVELMPLYYTTPRTIPVIDSEGKRTYVKINQEGGISMDYDNDALQVHVEAGVSFGIQQAKALQQITALSHGMPIFGEFINETSLDVLVDNIECRGQETIKSRASPWMQSRAQAKQQMMQAQSQQPRIEQQAIQVAAQQVQSEHQAVMAKVQQQAQAEMLKAQQKAAELEIDKLKLQLQLAEMLSKQRIEEERLGIEQQRADDERINTVIDATIKQSEHQHGLAHKNFERSMSALQMDREHERAEKEADAAMAKIVKGE